jgi:uncharacterized membrane protein YidH (DUF202 family)
MDARRNLIAVLLTITGFTLLGLATLDWIDYQWTLHYHMRAR